MTKSSKSLFAPVFLLLIGTWPISIGTLLIADGTYPVGVAFVAVGLTLQVLGLRPLVRRKSASRSIVTTAVISIAALPVSFIAGYSIAHALAITVCTLTGCG